ncbi:uncharacterized protein LOC130826505 [Amaranthus tricolor]|uniref:uncharacterized protein LOC130826505 n=1 Tax=Amaranthus tricolor TaxID=29722 RepID=UPI0025900940|nr:uncharacterized protein LOC130826505 [Amaranthus tricolor]
MRQGATALQKCTTAIRMLAYGWAADQIDEYLKLGATTSKECLTHFVDGMYQGRSRTTNVILEAVASRDIWTWHAFFGTLGSCNDINVLQRSSIFDDLLNGRAPQVQFDVNGNTYNKGKVHERMLNVPLVYYKLYLQ